MPTRREIIQRIAAPLTPLYGEREARAVALLAAERLTGLRREALLTDPNAETEAKGLEEVLAQLAAGRPVQYVLGEAEFCGLHLTVREGVLIPRPETEELVEWIAGAEPAAARLLDVGTGSGCIAIALKRRLPDAELFAADISDEALTVAAENCRRNAAKVVLRRADALDGLQTVFPERFDVIVSNPPYVPQRDLPTMHANVRDYEPHTALFVPDDDPLRFYRAIAQAGRQMLVPDGRLYFEIYEHYAEELCRLLETSGYRDIELRRDFCDKPRMLCCRLKNE